MRHHATLVAALVLGALGAANFGSGTSSAAQPAAAAVPAAPQDGSAIATPVADTFVAIGLKEPQGHLNMLIAGEKHGGDFAIFVKFPLPMEKIGEGATITGAELRMYKREPCTLDDPGPVQFDVRVVTKGFIENGDRGTVWDNKPPSAGPTSRWTVTDPEQLGYAAVDVTEAVKQWYEGKNENHGFEIRADFDNQSRTCTFFSREIGDYPLSSPPLLAITWTGGVTPSPTPSMSPTASNTPTPSNTPTASNTPTVTDTPAVTDTPTATETPRPKPVFLPHALNREDMLQTYTPSPPEGTEAPTMTPVPAPTDTAEAPTEEPSPTGEMPTDEPTPAMTEPAPTATVGAPRPAVWRGWLQRLERP